MNDRVDLDINITINTGGELLVNTLESVWIAADQISGLMEYFGEKLEGIKLYPDDSESRRTLGVTLSALGLISREARRMESVFKNLYEIALSAAVEATA